MILIDKMKNMKIYKSRTFWKTLRENKKKGAITIILSPNFESTKKVMNNKMFINNGRYESYYMDRDVSFYIGSKKEIEEVDESVIIDNQQELFYYTETKRSELLDSAFGVPSKRKFPLDTEAHVRSAIKFFNYVDPEDEEELARRIIAAMKKFNITDVKVGKRNRFSKYYHPDNTNESVEDIVAFAINSHPKYTLFRITANGKGIYEALKSKLSKEDWEKFINNKSINGWLKDPGKEAYDTTNKAFKYKKIESYFTRDGFKIFKEKVLPEISKYINKKDIKVKTYNRSNLEKIGNSVYTDKYQVLYGILDNTNESSVEEGAILNEPDILYNKSKFDSGEINICFVTGLSGSGKSTLANKMEKNGVEKYELDDVFANYNFSDDNLKEYGDLINSYFNSVGKKYRLHSEEEVYNWTDVEEKGCLRSFVDYAIKYANSHKNKKFVIEGVELYWFMKPEELKDYAVYIKGTSALISMIRSAKRDSGDASGLARVSSFLQNLLRKDRAHAYFQTEKTIKIWRDYFTSLETNENK